jgi:hypothetical protein
VASVDQRSISLEEIVGALHAGRAALEQENWVTLTGKGKSEMETTSQTEDQGARTATDQSITASSDVGSRSRPISEGATSVSEEARRRALEGILEFRALRERILTRRGGMPFTEEELTGALHEARAAHDRGE